MTTPRAVAALTLAALGALPVSAAPAKAPRKPAAAATPTAAPADVQVSISDLVDRRRSSDFPPPQLSLALKLEGADAGAIQAVRARVTRAQDDTGRDLVEKPGSGGSSEEPWQEAREGAPPTPQVTLQSPARKAKVLAAFEGTLEADLPGRDPSALVKVEKIAARTDKPAAPIPALTKHRIALRVLSKAGLEKEKKADEAKKKAAAARKPKAKPGMEEAVDAMAGAMADAMGSVFERLFMMANDNDLVLKVDDPGKKIFSFGLAAADGTPIQSFGTTEVESYRIVRLFEPLPAGAALEVRLKTPRSFAEVPFAIADVRLP
jgi:hypothetical protein